ncbi:MAG: tRNA glutamyl-Q(34) synthetase GluQRS [Mangrovicoccus sp.]
MRTRFAPSPTGPLHLGHAFSALTAQDLARRLGGEFLLRIEDIDRSRARSEWEAQIFDDLRWLGLSWPEPVMRQSERLGIYHAALEKLWEQGLLYPCTCRRRDIQEALSAPQEGAPLMGPDGLVYPGICREKPVRSGHMPENIPLRLDIAAALSALGDPEITWQEIGDQITPSRLSPDQMRSQIGDVILARRDMGTSYHLSVVLDDADQAITHVVRGADLAEATPIHRLLQGLLNLPEPLYLHHRLIRDETGKRLAKRDDARALTLYRAAGQSPLEIRQAVWFTPSAP